MQRQGLKSTYLSICSNLIKCLNFGKPTTPCFCIGVVTCRFNLIVMRLEQITKPFLESDLSIKDFSDVVGLTSARVSQILIRDLNNVHYKLFKDSDFHLRKVPLRKEDRERWLNRVNEYIEIINLPEKIKRDNRKISDLTVEEFIALMSSLNGR